MAQYLIVTNPFGDYQRGDQISDPATIAEIRASHNAANVVPITAPAEPAADAAPAA